MFMGAHARMSHDASVCNKVCCMFMSHISDSPSPLSCFIGRPCCSRTVTSTSRSRPHRFLRALPDPEARAKRTSRRSAEEFGYLADPTHSTSPIGSGPDLDGMGHRSFDAQFKELRDVLATDRQHLLYQDGRIDRNGTGRQLPHDTHMQD